MNLTRYYRKTILIILSIIVLVASLAIGCSQSSLAISSENGPLAPDFTLPTLYGEMLTLSELRGRPVLLKFWTTWCTSCRYQMPFIQEAFEEKGQEVHFISVNIGEKQDHVRKHVEDKGLGFTVALDRNRTVASDYSVAAIPVIFFIDENGTVKHRKLGPFGSTDEVLNAIDELFKL